MNLDAVIRKEVPEEKSPTISSRAVKSCGESETLMLNLKQQCSFHHSHCDCRYTHNSKLIPRNLCVEFFEVPSLKVLSEDAILLESSSKKSAEVQAEDCVDKYQIPCNDNDEDSCWNSGKLEVDAEVISKNKSDMELTPSREEPSGSPEPLDNEGRRVVNMMCNIKGREEGPGLLMTILVRMDDKMNRQLSCVVDETDTPYDLASELVDHGFIHEADRDKLAQLIEDSIYSKLTGVVSRSSSSASAMIHPGEDINNGTESTGTGILFYPLPSASPSSVTINSVS